MSARNRNFLFLLFMSCVLICIVCAAFTLNQSIVGQLLSSPLRSTVLFPEEEKNGVKNDRIEAQLRFHTNAETNKPLLIYEESDFDNKEEVVFNRDDCPVQCYFTKDDSMIEASDVLLFTPNFLDRLPRARRSDQLWILQLLESPANTPSLDDFYSKINYTSSYRTDSDFVSPYGRFVPAVNSSWSINFQGKKKMAAWFVSHCLTPNYRMNYAKQLADYIQVDIFGDCGDGYRSSEEMTSTLKKDYKFYIAFENSNCREYITEKFFENAFRNDVIPIVMGASRADYERVAPDHSFIHIEDFQSPKLLAEYLRYLSTNESAYMEYFSWRSSWKLDDSHLHCRICTVLQVPHYKVYADVNTWWHGRNDCTATVAPPHSS